jgi:hypothetical protein
MYQSINRSRSADPVQQGETKETNYSIPRAVSRHIGRKSKKQAGRSHSDSEVEAQRKARRTGTRTYSEGDKGQRVEEHKVQTKIGNGIPNHRLGLQGLSLDEVNIDIRASAVPHSPVTATLGNFRGKIITPEGIRNGFRTLGSSHDSVRSGTISRKNKEEAISYFVIKFLNNDSHVYHPGDCVEGHVILDANRSFTALGIDLIIRARGSLTVCKDGVVSHRKSELYLEKTSRMLGRSDGRMILITPGHYVSTFTYQLPNKLPSSILSENTVNNISFKLDVSYTAQAVIYDEMYSKVTNQNQGSPHATRGIHLHRGDNYHVVAKPIKVSARQFKVVSVPDMPITLNNTKPVCHSQNLSNNDGVILAMESTIVYPGSEVEMHLEADEDAVKLIKGIKVELMQRIRIPNTHHDIYRSLKEDVHDPAKRKRSGTIVTWDTTMKMPNSLTPTYKEIINLVTVEYGLKVTLKLPSKQLFMRIPIEVRRIPNPTDQTTTMPDFRMVTRFTNLSNTKPKDIENGHVRPEEAKVYVEYRHNSWIQRNSNMCSCLKL